MERLKHNVCILLGTVYVTTVSRCRASFTSITDLLLTQSIISFVITGPVQPNLDDVSSNSDISDEDDGDIDSMAKFNDRKNTAMIRLHCIQTK